MAHLSLSFKLHLLCILCISGMVVEAATTRHSRARARAYIEKSCQATRYPALCIKCLSGFANSNYTIQTPQQLAQLALSVSLYKATYTRSYMLKVAKELKAIKAKEYQTVKDCLDQINDSVDQLSQSIRELRRLGAAPEMAGDDIFLHINNVETWVSSALTDASNCIGELPARRNMSKLKATIKGKVLNVAQTASNALALFHRYAARYRRAGATTKKP